MKFFGLLCVILYAGMIAISLGTLFNGIRQGSVHPQHT